MVIGWFDTNCANACSTASVDGIARYQTFANGGSGSITAGGDRTEIN
jgi:hypothetical protein